MSKALLGLFCLLAASAIGRGDDRFTLAIGVRDDLVISSPNGGTVAELALSTIGKPVTVGHATFRVSFDRDANRLLTAVVSADEKSPSLHFDVLGRSVEADRGAVVTLAFAADARSVGIDPGYIGEVLVDSQPLALHTIAADDAANPQPPVEPPLVPFPVNSIEAISDPPFAYHVRAMPGSFHRQATASRTPPAGPAASL
jgi:hypothetical protein